VVAGRGFVRTRETG